jgi:hypothetical protein
MGSPDAAWVWEPSRRSKAYKIQPCFNEFGTRLFSAPCHRDEAHLRAFLLMRRIHSVRFGIEQDSRAFQDDGFTVFEIGQEFLNASKGTS